MFWYVAVRSHNRTKTRSGVFFNVIVRWFILVAMKKRDKKKQDKLQKAAVKRALYEKSRKRAIKDKLAH